MYREVNSAVLRRGSPLERRLGGARSDQKQVSRAVQGCVRGNDFVLRCGQVTQRSRVMATGDTGLLQLRGTVRNAAHRQ